MKEKVAHNSVRPFNQYAILALVFMVTLPIAGIVFSIKGILKAKKMPGVRGGWMGGAITALVLSVVFLPGSIYQTIDAVQFMVSDDPFNELSDDGFSLPHVIIEGENKLQTTEEEAPTNE